MDKNETRQKFINIRDNIENRELKEQKIYNNLFSSVDIETIILSYMSIKSEVSTDLINKNIKNLSLPLVKGDFLIPKLVLDIKKDTKLGNFNILEPYEHLKTATNIDICIVPAICFSKNKHRIGYGKGFYDRFLNDKSIFKIGICFEEQICEKIKSQDFDIKMDIIVTDKNIYK